MDNTEIVTKEEILEFQRLCKTVKGIDLTFEEAKEQATKLIQAFDILLDHNLTIRDFNN